MSVTAEEPAASSPHVELGPAASAAQHPSPGGAHPGEESLLSTGSTDNYLLEHPISPENTSTSHLGALPDDGAHAHAARTDSDASAGTGNADPFLDTAEPTPALPPRPEEASADRMMGSTATPPPAVEQRPTVHATEGANEGRQEEINPAVASLRAMFPDFDVAVLQSVLDSVNGDQERALDILLGMSDPEYVSTQAATHAEQPSLELDEQLARQLMLEDQQQQQQQRHATGSSWPRRDQVEVPYQPRQTQGGQLRPPPAERKTDLEEIQRTMGQIAESGKRTFSSIVSKVKAKINEYEASRNGGQTHNGATPPQWGTAPPAQLDRHTASQAYQSYYGVEPSPGPTPASEQPITLNDHSTYGQVQGYDLDAPPAHHHPAQGAAAASPMPTPGVETGRPMTPPGGAGQRSPAASPSPSGDIPRPPPTSSGSPVNPARIGLLPRRPVSLLNTNSPPATRPSDEEELEYVENPFEERK